MSPVVWSWVFAGLAVLAVMLGIIWSQRQHIADGYVSRELAARNVKAHYHLTQVGLRTQRIENLVLGDPAHPDMTARSVEIDISYGSVLPHVAAVRARGVRLYGRVANGTLQLGELDKFRATSSAEPFLLPNLNLTLDDARARIDTPAGVVGVTMNGAGNLKSGFAGKVAAIMRNAHAAGCASAMLTAYLDTEITSGQPHIIGPVRSPALGCPTTGIAMANAVAQVDLTLSEAFDHWSGHIRLGAEAIRAQQATLGHPRIDVQLDGSPQQSKGRMALAARALVFSPIQSSAITADGSWSIKSGNSGQTIAMEGRVNAVDVNALDRNSMAEWRNAGDGTPLGPLVRQITDAMNTAGKSNRLASFVRIEQTGTGGRITLSDLQFNSQSGAHIGLAPKGSFAYRWPSGQWAMLGSVTSNGGGLPNAALRLSPAPNGGVSGQMFVDPYTSGAARLALDPIRFVAGHGATTRISTKIRLSGPLDGGSVAGLTLPFEAILRNGGTLTVNSRCVPMGFDALRYGSLALNRHSFTLCPQKGQALLQSGPRGMHGGGIINTLNLQGSLGGSAMRLTARNAQYVLTNGQFALNNPVLTLGKGEAPVRLSALNLTGFPAANGIGGAIDGVQAQIGSVPLLVRDGYAHWGYAGGALRLAGSVGIIDAATPDRFNPLRADDFSLSLIKGRINASGTLTLPKGSAPMARVQILHELASGTGTADLTVDGLRFNPALQPDQITRLALGVIANAQGVVTGTGHIAWSPNSITSTGQFDTTDMDFAAAFGPVKGFSTQIHFTDLIGLVTAPGQVATIKSVNPGVEVRDGNILYQLLPNQQVGIESGHWPFANGDLTLLPSVMDFGAERPRNLTFRVIGLDAGSFINTLELENVSATGTFDGLLPMVFDASGGRIVSGVLVARQSGLPPLVINQVQHLQIPCDTNRRGGTLSYVGQVSNENLGRMGRLAFDALKDLQYKCLTVLMDGALDGEVVTQIAFNGVNRGELSTVPKAFARQFMGLPFIFNVRIEAPFRGLINTARSFIDPSLLIRSQLGDQFAPVIENRLAVQPRESETDVTGDRK